jgi:nicotinamidase/pyrazinamidase
VVFLGFRVDKNDALIIVDVQKCFCPGGAVPVPEGDKIVPILNKYIEKFNMIGAKIYATRDWHPPNHSSFKAYDGIWDPHCVQETEGAEFHSDLRLPEDTEVISVGTDPFLEGYTGLENSSVMNQN